VPTGVRSTSGEREVPADEGCPDGETSSRGITDPYPLYIERMFCPRLCIFTESTNHYLYIPTPWKERRGGRTFLLPLEPPVAGDDVVVVRQWVLVIHVDGEQRDGVWRRYYMYMF
jgi:hypothetical protein